VFRFKLSFLQVVNHTRFKEFEKWTIVDLNKDWASTASQVTERQKRTEAESVTMQDGTNVEKVSVARNKWLYQIPSEEIGNRALTMYKVHELLPSCKSFFAVIMEQALDCHAEIPKRCPWS
jgi:hypothetical protein